MKINCSTRREILCPAVVGDKLYLGDGQSRKTKVNTERAHNLGGDPGVPFNIVRLLGSPLDLTGRCERSSTLNFHFVRDNWWVRVYRGACI